MLQLDNIEVSYGKIQALKGVSLTVKAGELVTLASPTRFARTKP